MWVPESWRLQVVGDPAFGSGTQTVTLRRAKNFTTKNTKATKGTKKTERATSGRRSRPSR